MEQARSMHQVPWMVPETPYDTRTPHVEAPPAPDHVIPLCCPRLVLIDHEHPGHDTSWRELPARHMEWAPAFDQTTQQSQPEWVCLRCNNTLTPEDRAMQHTEPAPHCPTHEPRRLAIDLPQNERGWVCSRGYPPHILPCEPTQIPNARTASHHQQQREQPNRTHTGQWYSQGPPNQHQDVPYANSWFFVPLLLAGGAGSKHKPNSSGEHIHTPDTSGKLSSTHLDTANPLARPPQHTRHTPTDGSRFRSPTSRRRASNLSAASRSRIFRTRRQPSPSPMGLKCRCLLHQQPFRKHCYNILG